MKALEIGRVGGWASLVWLLLLQPVAAADKNGVSPNTISVPKGPGSIEGLGESFQPALNTGTAKYSIALKLPPGTARKMPGLRLAYDGGGANGPLGCGWSLPLAFVQRRTDHGTPTYGEDVGFERHDTFINEQREELVPQANGDHFCKNEGAFIRYRWLGDYWEGTLPDGSRLEFGRTRGARVAEGTNHVFAWLLESDRDTHGNTIVYTYTNFPGGSNTNQKYLSGIAYGPGEPPWTNFHFVRLLYEDRPDWFEDCRSGFIVRTGKRLKSIVIGTQGPVLEGHVQGDFNQDGALDNLDWRYDLEYFSGRGTNAHCSLLTKVIAVGADGVTTLPPATFGYTVCEPPDEVSAEGKQIGTENEPGFVMDSSLVDFVDLNGDGLPDILKTGGGAHIGYLNLGAGTNESGRTIRWAGAAEVGAGSGDAWSFDLSAAATHLADMDGDGLADLVHKASTDNVFYFANSARLGWGERRMMSVGTYPPPAPFGDPQVRTADVDFDKRIDLIRADGLEFQIWFNLGQGLYSDRVTVPQSGSFDFSIASIQVADFNGDRVPDIVRVWPTGVEVAAGLGYGHFAESWFVAFPDYTLEGPLVPKVKMTDLNGDGLADVVIEQATDGALWFWLNQGNYTLSQRRIITGMPTQFGPTAVRRWVDINGNGTTDLVYADSSSVPKLRAVDLGEVLGYTQNPNALVAISNGIGRVTFIGYQSSTAFALEDAAAGRPWPDPVPFPVSVVGSMTNLDSLGHAYVTQFRYHDGYYDPVEKQFRGFARVEQVDAGDPTAPTLISRSYFDTGRAYEALKGKPLRMTTEQEDGLVFSDEFTAWTVPPIRLYTGTNGVPVSYAHPVGRTNVLKELGQGTERRLESEMDFDRYGNQTLQADYGIVEAGDRSAFNDERVVTTEYAINTNAWIVRHPARQELKDENGVILSRSESFYDDESFGGLDWGVVTRGNLTMKREWTNAASPQGYITSARVKYDTYGNSILILDPLAPAAGGAVDFSGGHVRQLEYDSRFHAYPQAETIHLGNGKAPLVYAAGYDEGFGFIISSTDFNGHTTSYHHDVFARLTAMVKPGDTPGYPTAEYSYVLAVPLSGGQLVNYVETRELNRPPGSFATKPDHYFISRTFVDGLSRNLLTKAKAEPAPGGTDPRVVVTGATQFNARQKPAGVLNPYFSLLEGTLEERLAFENIESAGWQGLFPNGAALVALGLASADKTATNYDATLRPARVTLPDGTFQRTVYEPLVTRSYDENDTDTNSASFATPMVHYRDGLGHLVKVEELVKLNDDGTPAAQLKVWATRYEYDLNDQITHITDSQNNLKSFVYDGLKRVTFMSDPDRGTMQFDYDAASNLEGIIDAKQQVCAYTYDGVNRVLTEDYQDGQPPPRWRLSGDGLSHKLVYHYDTPFANLPQGDNTVATARNVKGALAWVEDLSGEEHTSYDERGRVEWSVKRIADGGFLTARTPQPTTPLVSYRTAFAYNPRDQVVTLVYPDGDSLDYKYNQRNLLERIPGGPNGSIIDGILYLPSAQIRQIDYGNGVRTSYDYDCRLRLKKLLTVSQPSALNLELIDFEYGFDGASNIKSIADLRPGSTVPAGDPRRNTQNFRYDDLDRLTQVQYSFTLPGEALRNDGEINYRYDRIGNMLAQTSTLEHRDRGLPVANLGEMDSGGSAGRWNRAGRGPSDPAGPHALTAIRSPGSAIRAYAYDPNGNMTSIDGLGCAWDFKDRLISVEDAAMQGAYTYDYADRRILKAVWPKSITNSPSGTNARPWTVAYINKYYELREHDAPTKYVWNGNTRVARVTGSLNTHFRVQRLRVWPGWNLVSLAVSASNALQQLAESQPATLDVGLARKWDPALQNWQSVGAQETLPAGTVLWLKASTNASLAVSGLYSEPTNRLVPVGGGFFPAFGLVPWDLSSSLSNQPTVAIWRFEAQDGDWLSWLPLPLRLATNTPAFIAPSEAIFARADAPAQLEVPDSALQVCFYHQDHLGSSTSLTDQHANIVESSAYFPFGHERTTAGSHPGIGRYGFTQKERDEETALSYFERRYLHGAFGRFIRLDPLASSPPDRWYGTPQLLNLYAYAANNPLFYVDPTGQTIVVAGDALFRVKVGAALRSIDPSIIVNLKTGVVSIDTSKNAQGHESGHKLIDRMVKSAHAITIKNQTELNKGNVAGAADAALAASTGSGGSVKWIPGGKLDVPTLNAQNTEEMKARPSFIGLAHELIHGDHYQRGVYKASRDQEAYTTLAGQAAHARLEELRTVGLKGTTADDVTENQLRTEAGCGARTRYGQN